MNFEEAIRAHTKWKARLRLYLTTLGSEGLDAELIAKEDECELGQWLHGPGAAHAKLREYEELKLRHAAFHRAAADIVTTAATDKDAALGLLDEEATFSVLSAQVVAAIRAFTTKLKAR